MNDLLQGNILLSLAAALLWGGGDFSGGMCVKKVGGSLGGALRIVLLSHLVSITALLGIALLQGTPFPHGRILAGGLVAGVAGGLAITGFYIALSRGSMGASAAISGLMAAAIPAIYSSFTEGFPGPLRLGGFCVAGIAIWLIASEPEQLGSSLKPAQKSLMGLAVLCGVGFGIYFIGLKVAGPGGSIWAMATTRMGSLTVCSLLLAVLTLKGGGPRVTIGWASLRWVLLTALLDTSGSLLYVAATRAGRLDVASVLASLYPASTILLAAWMLKEHPTRRQGLGMAVVAIAIVMITLQS